MSHIVDTAGEIPSVAIIKPIFRGQNTHGIVANREVSICVNRKVSSDHAQKKPWSGGQGFGKGAIERLTGV